MNTTTPFYVFSVERAELSKEENRGRVEFVAAYLYRAGIPFMRVCGRYNGTQETAFLVADRTGEGCRAYVQNLARLYEQESVLHVDANGQAYLYSSEGGLLATLGRWHEVTAREAATLEAVTEHNGRYWSATG